MELRGASAIVTGASGGIGEAFARRLAAEGADVVLVARSADKLEKLAGELAGVRTLVVPLDLSDRDAGARVLAATDEAGWTIDLLVNNAGRGASGDFVDLPIETSLEQVDLDVRAVVDLTARYLPGMLARRRGAILNLASTAAFQPTPTLAVYGAAKAFVRSLTEALADETRGSGVRVMAIAPGAVETGFFDAAGAQFLRHGRMTPEQVVDAALRGLDGSAVVVVPGLANKPGTLGERFAPRGALVRGSRRIVKPS